MWQRSRSVPLLMPGSPPFFNDVLRANTQILMGQDIIHPYSTELVCQYDQIWTRLFSRSATYKRP
jgi:hypothetical protein